MIPSLVDGPMPIRMVAPPKKERVVHCDYLPITWKKHEDGGHKLRPHIEATLDCLSSKAIRSMSCLVRKYLRKLSIDVAVVVAKPQDQTEPEPTA